MSLTIKKTNDNRQNAANTAARPVLLLTIANGAGHTQAAEAIAAAWRKVHPKIPANVVEVSAFMSEKARFTHVTAYLWLVKNAPAVWKKIDAFQKRRTQTSPDWFYRRECRKLFDLAWEIQPSALAATEVGCLEIAALIKRDLKLDIPLVAVNVNYDADLAWIQPEVDAYCLATDAVREDYEANGAAADKIFAWGLPMRKEFASPTKFERETERRAVCEWLGLPFDAPLILIAGGGEGIGKIREIAGRLIEKNFKASIVVLAGNNEKLKRDCEKLAAKTNCLRVLGWTHRVPQLYRAGDVLISKLGNTFDEAVACRLPIIALEPPPGAERVQFELLEKWNVGRTAESLNALVKIVGELLGKPRILAEMRENAADYGKPNAAEKIAGWIAGQIGAADEKKIFEQAILPPTRTAENEFRI